MYGDEFADHSGKTGVAYTHNKDGNILIVQQNLTKGEVSLVVSSQDITGDVTTAVFTLDRMEFSYFAACMARAEAEQDLYDAQ